MARGITLPGLRLHETATNEWGWGFHTVRGGIDPGDHRFRPLMLEVQGCCRISHLMRPYRLRVRQVLEVGKRGNSRRALSP